MPNPAAATIRISISTSSPPAATVRADRFATKAKQTEGLEGLPGQGEKGVDAWVADVERAWMRGGDGAWHGG
ncbi:hypothetical protein CDEST_05285 [Colletotrichum destructivum]|uniref:Uncharacterized protein n=1 Tax=Colletotrichum destructivum TaxID=34406 RepID=A0AAX4IAB2_9PEZI|nr:hypothetical protein CDEST_05285 [Colletotrichum destructivum]